MKKKTFNEPVHQLSQHLQQGALKIMAADIKPLMLFGEIGLYIKLGNKNS